MANNNNDEKKYLFDKPKNVKRLLYGLYTCCFILVLLEFVIHRHIYHSWEELFGFYPIYGFIGCVLLVLIAKWMRTFLMRDEDYYDKLEQKQHQLKKDAESSNVQVKETKGGDDVDA